ncbi:MAG: integral rane sensor signal transduction histidine kinase [Deltaproteobacteria bacterium]|nr:integral rane sensor signal transduction histidine kinase [Deltaproteobacteria bacterium]
MIISIIAVFALMYLAALAIYRERSRAGLFLGAALAVTAALELFDMCSLHRSLDVLAWKRYALFCEGLLPPLWILCSLTYARQSRDWKTGWLLKTLVVLTLLFSIVTVTIPLGSFFYAPDFPRERLLFLSTTGFFFYIGIMSCLVIALVNFETTLANASPDSLGKIKFNIIGLGTILAVLIFYFSQAILYRTLSMNYAVLRSFLYIVAAAMIGYAQIFQSGSVRIQVSRQTAFKSFVLLAVGIYLVLTGLLGEGMQHLGIHFPRAVTVSVAFLSGIALLILLLSERVRREVKVVLQKNFYQNKHDYRTQWLSFTEQLSTSRSSEQLLQRILSAYCDIFGITGAALFLNEESHGGYCMTALYNMEPIQEVIAPGNSLVRFMQESAWVVNVKDDNPAMLAENEIFFSRNNISIIIPLFDGERLEGFIALGKAIKTNEVYIYEDYDLMKTIARQASLAILHQRLSAQLIHAREMEAVGKVSAFVAHDLKNLVSNLSLIVDNAGKYIHNPDFQKDMLASLNNTAGKMQKLIGRLKKLGERELLNQQPVNLLDLVEKTVRMFAGARISMSGKPETALVDENEIQNVVMNLLINGIEASGPNEPLLVEVGSVDVPFIRVTDHGCGMSSQYIRTELFMPFRTTKKQGLGIGLYQCRQIMEAHGGRIEVSSVEGSGSVFTLWFPTAGEEGPEKC